MAGEVEVLRSANSVFALVEELKRCTIQIDMMFLKIGAILSRIKEDNLYLAYAAHTTNMSSFLRDIDIGIGLSQCDHYIRVWKTFGRYIEGRRIPFKRLLMIHPLVKDDQSREHWMEQAENLPYRALVDALSVERGRTPVDACAHPQEALRPFYKCSVCGAWIPGSVSEQ